MYIWGSLPPEKTAGRDGMEPPIPCRAAGIWLLAVAWAGASSPLVLII